MEVGGQKSAGVCVNIKGGGSLLEETSLEVVGVKLCMYERDTERQTERKGGVFS